MSEVELKPCPWCKAIPKPCGHYFEVFHESWCFFAETDSYNTRQIIVKRQVERWNTVPVATEPEDGLLGAAVSAIQGLMKKLDSDVSCIYVTREYCKKANAKDCAYHTAANLLTALSSTTKTASGLATEAEQNQEREMSAWVEREKNAPPAMTANGHKEHPILFSGPMVRAILEGRKTQTRRVVKPLPPWFNRVHGCSGIVDPSTGRTLRYEALSDSTGEFYKFCPYGDPLDRLWVRETHGIFSADDGGTVSVGYKERLPAGKTLADTDGGLDVIRVTPGQYGWAYDHIDCERWRPSIFMPRWASRLTLDIASVRVERLQDISVDDIRAEGIALPPTELYAEINTGTKLRQQWQWGWEKINGKRKGCAWADNPWVWVVEFRKVAQHA